jgi:phage FluMu gp28-like protein
MASPKKQSGKKITKSQTPITKFQKDTGGEAAADSLDIGHCNLGFGAQRLRPRASAAFEQLAARVEAARAKAMSAPVFSSPLAERRAQAEAHKPGASCAGWKNPYPPGDPRSLLLEYQFKLFHDRARFKAALQARQTGKDFTSEGEVVETCKAGVTEWMIAAPSERQALDSLDQAKLWAEAWDFHLADLHIERMNGPNTLLKAAEVTFSNGSRIRAVPGRPDTVRGRSTNVLLTEFDFFENPAETWRAIVPSITNPLRGGQKVLRAVSTPNGKNGQMAKIFGINEGGKREKKFDWSRHTVTIYDAVLCGLPVNIEELRELFDDPEGWAQEFECEFLDSSNVLLPYDIIALAESIDAGEVTDPAFWQTRGGGPVVCGIDFGRTNDPTVCWTLQKTGDVWVTREVLVIRNTPTPEQQQQLAPRIARASRVCLDYTGPGIGIGDYLAKDFKRWAPEKHELGKIELCVFTTGLKRDIFPKLRRAFEAPVRLRIPISTVIREDLHAMQQIIRNGEYTYAAPRTAEGHSDRCTALALALRAAGSAGAGEAFTAETLEAVVLGAAARGPVFSRPEVHF